MNDRYTENVMRERSVKRPFRILVMLIGSVSISAVIVSLWLFALLSPPTSFPIAEPISISEGASAATASETLAAQGVVRSATLLYFALILFHDPGAIKAGSYRFTEPLHTLAVAERITGDAPLGNTVALTFPEGVAVSEMADIAEDTLTTFQRDVFLTRAVEYEGFLFPDTYYVAPEISALDLIALLRETYTEKTASLFQQFKTELSEYEIVTMASILEREANSRESMRRVSGILQNRLAIDMPLQADATLEYVLSKPLSELTPDDLMIDSPYNTYKNRGLPPTPIGNPGLMALRAALMPEDTEYFYYITAPDGTFYYAETLEGHQQNIEAYLK